MSAKANQESARSFNRQAWYAAAAFGLILAILIGLNLLSGPRLRSVSFDSSKITSQSGQRITLKANQPLAKVQASAIRIVPTTAFTVTSNADTITITLKERLRYATKYTVSVTDVSGIASKAKKSQFVHTFNTDSQRIFYLKRAANYDNKAADNDRIMQASLYEDKVETVFSAKKIIDYVAMDGKLIVSSTEGGDTGKLSLVNIHTKQVSGIKQPGEGLAVNLRASANGSAFGYTFTSPPSEDQSQAESQYYDTLFVSDIKASSDHKPISGVGGKPIGVEDWEFAPDGTSIIAHLDDRSLLLIDGTFRHKPVPFSTFLAMSNFSPDGTKLLVKQKGDYAMLDLRSRKAEPIPDSSLSSSETNTLLGMIMLPSDKGYVQHYEAFDEARSGSIASFKLHQNGTKKVIYDTQQRSIAVQNVDLTSNGQLLIVESAPDEKLDSDEYPAATFRALATSTELIDMVSGKVVKQLDGIKVTVR